ncbi:MFS transporter [uncultured Roseobacter sp.]|uniref:MFS transporter n=1 Tax=uncultured Roseobacter sp. TaxID=114847 RepID=UPI00345C21FF
MVGRATKTERDVLWSVALLTFAAGFVAQFFAQGVVLFLREAGVSSAVIGLLYIAAIPYTLRFVWAPIIDRNDLGGGGRFERWIYLCCFALCFVLSVLWFFEPARHAAQIIICVGLGMFVLGTLQTALGGVLVEGLAEPSYPKGASLQAAVSAMAGMVLGGAVLFLLGPLGWGPVVLALLVVCIVVAGLAGFALNLGHGAKQTPATPPKLWDQFSIFKIARARHLLLVSLCVSAASVLPYATKSVLLIDAGFSVSQSGLIGIVAGNATGFIGALASRPLVERWGGMRVLAALAVLNAVVVLVMTYILAFNIGPIPIVALILFANFSVFGAYTASRSILMPLCRVGHQATHLASFVGIEAMCFLVIAGLAISGLDKIGLVPLLLCGAVISCFGAALAFRDIMRRDASKAGTCISNEPCQ